MKLSLWCCHCSLFFSDGMHYFSLYRFVFIPGVRVHVHHSLMQEIQKKTSPGLAARWTLKLFFITFFCHRFIYKLCTEFVKYFSQLVDVNKVMKYFATICELSM